MASKFSFEVQGLNRLIKSVKKLGQEIEDRVDADIEKFVEEVNEEQVRKTPVNLNGLRVANQVRNIKPLNWELFNYILYAPYVDFGTGKLVNVPAELQDYAIQFKGRGIREVNLPARPFFFEPFMRRRKELVENIKKSIRAGRS